MSSLQPQWLMGRISANPRRGVCQTTATFTSACTMFRLVATPHPSPVTHAESGVEGCLVSVTLHVAAVCGRQG